jgi:hypothetical protein
MFNEIGIIIVILGLAVLIFLTFKNYEPQIKKFISNHLVAEFPSQYHPQCFDCNRGNCIEPDVCEIIVKNCEESEEE